MTRRLPYVEGDWFGVPLTGGQWAVGRIARLHPGGKILFVYLYGAFTALPPAGELEKLRPADAVLVGMVGDLGLVRREWPVIGHAKWRREEWPLVSLSNVDPITKRVRRVEYRDGDLATPAVWEVVDGPLPGPPDTLYGHLALQARLSKMLTTEGS